MCCVTFGGRLLEREPPRRCRGAQWLGAQCGWAFSGWAFSGWASLWEYQAAQSRQARAEEAQGVTL